MSEIQNVHLVVAYFDDVDAAKKALDELKKAHKEEALPLDGAAIVHRKEDDKLDLKELGDMHATRGAGVGALIGGALGALFGPLGVIGGGAIGAYYGGIVAATVDEGIPNQALEEIGALLPVGDTALVVLISEERAKEVESELAALGGQVVTNGGQQAQIVIPDGVDLAEDAEEGEAAEADETPNEEN